MSDFVYSDDRDGRRWRVRWPRFRVETPECVEEEVARLLGEGRIVGVFWGRSEFGPRALGNRSILADPRSEEIRDRLNERVKHRQWFRPYAPVVLEEKAAEWFVLDQPSPYMLIVARVRKEKRPLVPAITHVDGTARVQTVAPGGNSRIRRVVEAFDRATGVPMVLNTSFNIHGEPIVCTPEDAYKCFMRTEMDYLVVNNFLLSKTMQPDWENREKWKEKFNKD